MIRDTAPERQEWGMIGQRVVAALLMLIAVIGGPVLLGAAEAQSVAAVPPPPPAAPVPSEPAEPTPPRVSYVHGEVSFWRPGAPDWAPVQLNTPLAPGDVLYTGPQGQVEIQIGPRAFVRAAEATQVGLRSEEHTSE